MNNFNVGDIVHRKDGDQLRSSLKGYGAAIVSSVNPFELSSVSGDMLWCCTVSQEDFEVVGKISGWHFNLLKLKVNK